MDQTIVGFDFDSEQSFFSSLNEFRTTLGGLYMEKILVKKRAPSPVLITEDYKPYVTLDESRENEREERMARDQRAIDALRQEEYEKEVEARERESIIIREREREEARALSEAKFAERRRVQEIAMENERIRIERIEAERELIIKRSVEEQIEAHMEQERKWRSVNENISDLERSNDLMSEEEDEQKLEWEYEHLTDDEDAIDGAADVDPLYGLSSVDGIRKRDRKLVYRWGDLPPPDNASLSNQRGFKRKPKSALQSLHVKKTLRRDFDSDDDISDISDYNPDTPFLTALSSGEDDVMVNKRMSRHKSKARQVTFIPSGTKRTNVTDLLPKTKRRDTVRERVMGKGADFRPIQELPSYHNTFNRTLMRTFQNVLCLT